MRRARAVFRPNVKSVAASSRSKAPPATKDSPAKAQKKDPKEQKQEQKAVQEAQPDSKQQPEAKTVQNVSIPTPPQKHDSNTSVKPAQPAKSSNNQKDISTEQHDKNSGKNTDASTVDKTVSNKEKTKNAGTAAATESRKDDKTSADDGQKTATSAAVRRKRVMAVPNLGRRRQSAPTAGKPAVTEEKEPAQSDGDKKEQQSGEKEFQEPPPVQRMTEAFGSKPPPRHLPPLVLPRRRLDSTSSVDGREGMERPLTIPHRERRVSGMYTPNIQPERRREKDQEEEEGPAKRRQRHNQSKPPDKNRMTMADLIYYNPKTNMMKSTEEKARRLKEKKKQTKDGGDDGASERAQEEMEEDHLLEEEGRQDKTNVDEDPDADDSLLVPQVRVAEDGTIVLNEQSLTVSTPAKKAGSDSDIVQEDESHTTYSSFRKKVPQTQAWNMKETIKFYKALSTVGTDFTLMAAMIPKRTRAQLKAKFKKEEKQNRNLVDRALGLRQEFDMSIFEQSESDSEDEKKKRKENRRVKGRLKGVEGDDGGKRKANENHDGEPAPMQRRLSTALTASSDNVSGFPSYQPGNPNIRRDVDGNSEKHRKEHTEDADDENEEEETRIVEMLKGPTRAGRQPKRVQTFSINIEPTRKRARPPTVVNRASPIASPPRFSPLKGSSSSPGHSSGSAGRKRWLYIPGETGPRPERSQSQESGKEQEDSHEEEEEEVVETVMIQSPVRFESEPLQPTGAQLIQGTALNGTVVVGDVEELVITDDEGIRPTATTAQYTLVIPVMNTNSPGGAVSQTVSVVVPSPATRSTPTDRSSPGGAAEQLSLRFVTGEHLTARDILEQMQMEGGARGEDGDASGAEEEEEEEEEVVIGEEMITEIVTEIAKEQPNMDSAMDKDGAGLEAES